MNPKSAENVQQATMCVQTLTLINGRNSTKPAFKLCTRLIQTKSIPSSCDLNTHGTQYIQLNHDLIDPNASETVQPGKLTDEC